MTHLDHANADIIRQDLTRLIVEAVVTIAGEGARDEAENLCDASTTDELWVAAAAYDTL